MRGKQSLTWKSQVPARIRKKVIEVVNASGVYYRLYSERKRMKFLGFSSSSCPHPMYVTVIQARLKKALKKALKTPFVVEYRGGERSFPSLIIYFDV